MITDRDRAIFTEGDCHLLAIELHKRGVGKLHSFACPDEGDTDLHAFVILPDGRILDVEGIYEGDEPYGRYWGRKCYCIDRPQIIEAAPEDFDRWGYEPVFAETAERLPLVADMLTDLVAGKKSACERPTADTPVEIEASTH